ncbi:MULTISPECIES: hypothetical protein [Methylobacterium]|uniref:hypothetical protein n=1 Tax=Methylobacterium TaxID=407 RepID=UPI0013EA4F88|nr:hypothetical protein [Methylobacterium sp. DB0501]NGM32912.1 hypothetical protein [Methylobacterium sp. DB0501]
MADQDWRSVISDDGQAAVITLPQGATEEATIVFHSVDDLDRLIQMVGVLRAQMTPPVPTTPHDTDIPMSTTSPVWAALADRTDGKRPLLIRHPGLGWIGFLFDDDSAAMLAASLTSPSVAR